MTKELQDKAWACLPKEVRENIIAEYCNTPNTKWHDGYNSGFEYIFGVHNLTSDTEPEEMLMVSVKKVVERVRYLKAYPKEYSVNESNARASELLSFFSNKCLSDKDEQTLEHTSIQAAEVVRKALEEFHNRKEDKK